MKHRHLEIFRALMEVGTTTGAAAALSISQPAVSRHISDLEDDLGFELFVRNRGRLEPTDDAIAFFDEVQENFLGLERLERAARRIRENSARELRVACLPALSASVMPHVLQRFDRTVGRSDVAVETCTMSQTLEHLQRMSVDLAMTLQFPAMSGIEFEPLISVDHLCALPEGHALCRKTVIEPQDFDGQDVIGWLAAGPVSFEQEDTLFDTARARRNIRFRTHTSNTRYAMVSAGLGITLVEPFAAPLWSGHGLTVRRFRPAVPLSYVLAYPSGRLRSPPITRLRNLVRTVMAEKAAEIEALVDRQTPA